MKTKIQILNQIRNVTQKLVALSLSSEQNFPSEKDGFIYISEQYALSIALKNIPYKDIYDKYAEDGNYNIKMIDGGLIQMMYTFDNQGNLFKYRLGFFPSPYLEEFQNNSEIYEEDEIYADIISKNIVPTPIRFDYDPANAEPIEHPASHVTIGQYKNCRIPISHPITPNIFMDFILRNFYNTASRKFSTELSFDVQSLFDECIEASERKILYFNIL